ncbi:MAG: cupredoxin domain-containing protein [Anaerolineales bacterium]|nr:cupredoxin domain-containing protein [Anaerolineales bacterium]
MKNRRWPLSRRFFISTGIFALATMFLLLTSCTTGQALAHQGPAMSHGRHHGQAEARAPLDEVAVAEADVVLVTASSMKGLAFIGRGGEIDDEANPTLHTRVGESVTILLINGDAMVHNLAIDELGLLSRDLEAVDDHISLTFTPTEAGEFIYYCAIPGHRQAGMWGTIIVTDN